MKQIYEWLLGTQQQEMAGQAEWGFKFLADYNPYLKLFLFAVLAGLVVLTIRSYRREGDAKPAIKITLAALRTAVILLVVAILFRPAIVLRIVKTLHNTVLVLVDNSQSMAFSDRYAGDTTYQKRMADFLKVAPANLSEKTRLQIAKYALLRPNGTMAKLAEDHTLKTVLFSTTQPGKESYVRPLSPIDEVRAENDTTPVTGEPPAKLKQELDRFWTGLGYETNPPEAIRGAIDLNQGQRLGGIMIISDCQPTSEEGGSRSNSLISAKQYAWEQLGVPIYVVCVGDPTPPKNITVTALQAPREARLSSEMDLTVIMSQRNLDGQNVEVKVERRQSERPDKPGNWEAVDKKTVRLQAADSGSTGSKGLQNVPFKIKLEDKIGEFGEGKKKASEYVYRGSVTTRADEQNTADNSAETLIRIVDSKINVLLIAGDSGWEFQYLRNLFQRQGDLYRVSVWQQNAEPEVSQAASSPDMVLQKMPQDLSELIGDPKDPKKPGYKVIILYDPQRTKDGFDEKFLTALKQFVQLHSGGVCYIAGNKYTDVNLLGTKTTPPLKDLAAMMPVVVKENMGADTEQLLNGGRPLEPWHATVNSYSVDHPITRLGETTGSTYKIWGSLPGLYWSHPVDRIKPGARVLLESENPQRQTSNRDREPVLALHMYGSGPVIYMGTDDTWRWRVVEDAKYHKQFWNHIVGFLATLRQSQVIITTGSDSFNVGDQVKVEVEAYDKGYNLLDKPNFTVEIFDTQTGKSDKLVLAKVEGKLGRYRGEFVAAHRGTFEITAKDVGDVDAKRITIKLPEAEAVHSEANEEVGKFMATNDRNFLRICDIDKLSELIPPGKLTSVQENPQELWDSRLMLCVLTVLLTIEWIFRKKFNMA